MKLAILSEGYDGLDLLMEANVFNNTEEHNGTSIKAFAEFYGDMLDTTQNKKAFVKKVSRLLINDPKYHHAMREVPPGAADWAHEAHGKQELVYFEPDTNLKQKMEHLTHWINALEHDAKQRQDKDKKVFATKELQGFGKAESLDVLEQKSNKYFARGSKKAAGDTSGLEPRLDAGGGFTWYEITEANALGREGKVLQNCIGSHYTQSKLARNNQKIYVLKSPQGETVVAIRTDEGKRTIVEIKGKQNRPPIEKYMVPVQKFIKKSKLTLSQYGQNDLENAGYFYVDGQVYTKTDAIKKFLTATHIGQLGYGLELFKVSSPPSASNILKNAYNIRKHDEGNFEVIETRRDGHPVISAIVRDGNLTDMVTHTASNALKESLILEAAKQSKLGRDSVEFVQHMLDHDMIKDIDGNLQKRMFWSNNLKYDRDARKVIPRSEGQATVEMDKKSPVKSWETYTKPQEVLNVLNSIASDQSWSKKRLQDLKEVFGEPHEINKIYLADAGKGDWMMVVVDKDNNGHPHDVIVNNHGVEMSHRNLFAGDKTARNEHSGTDQRKIQAVLDLANHHGFELPTEFNMLHNVKKNNGGEHQQHTITPTKVGKNVPADKYDFSDMDDDDRLQSMYHLYHKQGARFVGDNWSKKADSKFTMYDHHGSDSTTFHDHDDRRQHRRMLKGGYRDADTVYAFNVKYAGGKEHEVLALVKGDKIVRLDDTTDKHGWQAWSDSKDVANQLNMFADEQNLKIGRDALKGKRELRASARDNTFRTAEEAAAVNLTKQRERGHIGKEGTDEIHFKDGIKFERMEPEENGRLLRKMKGDTRGELWKIVDADGGSHANILVGKGGKVKGVYRSSWDLMDKNKRDEANASRSPEEITAMKQSTYMREHPGIYRHLKQAANKFDWTIDMKKDQISDDSTQARMLRTMRDEEDPMTRNQLWQHTFNRKAPVTSSGAASDNYLVKHGLATHDHSGNPVGRRGDWTRQSNIQITPTGKAFSDKLDRDGTAHPIDVASPAPLHPEWKEPTAKDKAKGKMKTAKKKATKKATKKAPSTKATRKGGATKSQQALDLYTQMVTDNDGNHPGRQEFIAAMKEPPYSMSDSGAATYHYNTKKKYNAQQDVTESLLQSFTGLERLIVG